MPGSRHSRNNTAGAVFSSVEIGQLTEYGTQKKRIGRDSKREVDSCCITQQPLVDPLASKYGFLYSKEAVYEHLLAQKKAIARHTAAWEQQQQLIESQNTEKTMILANNEADKFKEGSAITAVSNEDKIFKSPKEEVKSSIPGGVGTLDTPLGKIYYVKTEKDQNAGEDQVEMLERLSDMKKGQPGLKKNFWLPTETPEAAPTLVKKPSNKTICPESGNPMRAKDLIPVKFTVIPGQEKEVGNQNGCYMCPISRSTIRNEGGKIVLLRKCGHVMYFKSLKQVKMNNFRCIVCDTKFQKSHIIRIKNEGSSFAGGQDDPDTLIAKKITPAFAC